MSPTSESRHAPELIPIHRLPEYIPSSRANKRLSIPTVYRWILQGRLKSRKVGGSRYVTAEDLAEFLRGDPAVPRPFPCDRSLRAAERAGQELDTLIGKGGRR